MPVPLNVLFWNVQNFGDDTAYRNLYLPRCNFIAEICHANDVDVLWVQEVKHNAILTGRLHLLQHALCNLPAPNNVWYLDWILGAVSVFSNPPWATEMDLAWDYGHYEGYAVLWRQNLDRFRMTAAPPPNRTSDGVLTPNTQSHGVRAPNGVMLPATAVVGAGNAYSVSGVPYAGGTPVPNGTVLGAGGIVVTAANGNVYPVMGGNQQLNRALTLPPAGSVIIPQHAASLALVGRDNAQRTYFGQIRVPQAGRLGVDAFAPGMVNAFDEVYFVRGGGYHGQFEGPRRPTFAVVDVNDDGAWGGLPAHRLVPVAVYHAPAGATSSCVGTERSSFIRPLYQTFDPVANQWIDSNHAVLGGDFNVPLWQYQYPYNAFTATFANRGANCQILVDHQNPPVLPANVPANKTTARLQSFGGVVNSPNLDAYRGLAIDNAFHRGFAAVNAVNPVVDLLTDVLGGGLAGSIPSFRWLPLIMIYRNFLLTGMWPPAGQPVTELMSPLLFTLNLFQGSFGFVTPAPHYRERRAAEFVRLMVSDHLPILFQAQV